MIIFTKKKNILPVLIIFELLSWNEPMFEKKIISSRIFRLTSVNILTNCEPDVMQPSVILILRVLFVH